MFGIYPKFCGRNSDLEIVGKMFIALTKQASYHNISFRAFRVGISSIPISKMIIPWIYPPPRILVTTRMTWHFYSRESQPEPLFATGILARGQIQGMICHLMRFNDIWFWKTMIRLLPKKWNNWRVSWRVIMSSCYISSRQWSSDKVVWYCEAANFPMIQVVPSWSTDETKQGHHWRAPYQQMLYAGRDRGRFTAKGGILRSQRLKINTLWTM